MALNSANAAMPDEGSSLPRPIVEEPGYRVQSADPQAPAEIVILVSPDALKAYISILPGARPSVESLGASHILPRWQNLGLDPHLLTSDFLHTLTEEWNRNHRPIENVLAAEAEHPPVPGADARIEYLVDPEIRLGHMEQAGTVDFRNLNLIKPVKQGQPLARKHPPGKGGAGIDLFGRPASAPDGADIVLPVGPNTEASVVDPGLIIASVDGFLQKRDGVLSVNECFVVDGGVDYSTGNIDYSQNAIIRGDIADGFTVNVGGALEVGGSVGEARLTVGGDLLIKKGFVGAGHGLVTAKGSVSLGFVSNQSVRTHGDLNIEKESFNSRLASRKRITLLGPLVGGTAMAGLEILCRTAGNELGNKTELEAGLDYILHENRLLLEEKIRELAAHLSKVGQKLAKLKEAYRAKKRFTSGEARLLLELRDVQEKIQVRLPELERRKAEIAEQIRKGYLGDGIRVRVEKRVFPGTVIKVGSELLRIQEEMAGPKVFAYKQGRIKVF
jgi:uncharacterized protein (DUF342 family)